MSLIEFIGAGLVFFLGLCAITIFFTVWSGKKKSNDKSNQ